MTPYNITETGKSRTVTDTLLGTTISESVVNKRTRVLTVPVQVKNGDFRKPNALSFRKTVLQSHGLKSVVRSGAHGTWATQTTSGHLMPIDIGHQQPDIDAVLRDQVMQEIYEELRAGLNLAVDLAEGGQTLRLVKQVLLAGRTIRDVARKLKRAPFQVPAELWLSYRYGVMPLIYTAYDLLDAILKREAERDILVKKRAGRVRRSYLFTRTGTGEYVNPFVERKVDYDSRRLEIGILFKRPVNGLYDWTSLNPLGIAWELFPLSFVADWFVNVGDFLSAWENYVLWHDSFIMGYETRTKLTRFTETRYGTTNTKPSYWPNGSLKDGNYWRSTFGYGTGRKATMDRVRLLSLPLPEGIRVRVNLNAKRYADAAALVKVLSRSAR